VSKNKGTDFEMIAKTSFGFEDILSAELEELGAKKIRKVTRAVIFEGDERMMYLANLWCRTALRILKPIGSFPCASEQELYDGIRTIEWNKYLEADETLAVDSVVTKSNLTHSLYVSQKAKDGIVDQFRNRAGQRPNVELSRPKLRIHIHLNQDVASVSLDSSGESLHKRGYRQQQGDAPLNEALAAGMILLSGWDKKSPFLDLMCGSGTIPIEAALMARNIAPGIFRREFGFERWNDFDQDLWDEIIAEAKSNQLPSLDFRISGVDRSFEVIDFAKENIRYAGLDKDIDLYSMAFEDYNPEVVPSMIVTNPPYGGRITDDDLFLLYKNLGDAFKKKYPGCTAWVLTANKEASHKIGLHPTRKIPLFNGAMECRFLRYIMYSGSKKTGITTEQVKEN